MRAIPRIDAGTRESTSARFKLYLGWGVDEGPLRSRRAGSSDRTRSPGLAIKCSSQDKPRAMAGSPFSPRGQPLHDKGVETNWGHLRSSRSSLPRCAACRTSMDTAAFLWAHLARSSSAVNGDRHERGR